MRKNCITTFIGVAMMCSACNADDITVHYQGTTATVEQKVTDSVKVSVEGAKVMIESQYKAHQLRVRLTGSSDDGQFVLKSDGKAVVTMDGVNITSREGAAMWLKNKKKVEIVAANGTENSLLIEACQDTANHKSAALWSKDKLLLSGKGTLNITATGDGCRGIKAKHNITMEDLTLTVTTTGSHLGEDTTKRMGFGDPPPNFNPDDMPEEMKAQFEEMRKRFEEMMKNGDFPFGGDGFPPHFGNGRPPFGGEGMPPMGGGMPPMKRKYISPAKAITSTGKITINSGNITVSTSTAGAEGIEGKQGVVMNGGNINVLAMDDAINADERIYFNGAKVVARSISNDAVDANYGDTFPLFFGAPTDKNQQKEADPAIIITGGEVYAWSQIGAPEEGLDCDFSPIEVSGGKVFSVGAGMGEMPSVPTNETAHQPTALLIGLNITQDEPIEIRDEQGKLLNRLTVPFSFQRSASLISCPEFQVGSTYTIKTKDYEKTFKLTEAFTVVR